MTGPHANDCAPQPHLHVGICQRAGYANGLRDAGEERGEQAAVAAAADWLEKCCDENVPAQYPVERNAERGLIKIVREHLAALATATPVRLSDEEREALCVCPWDGPPCPEDAHSFACSQHREAVERILAARAVQPTPPAQAEAVAAVERVRALHTGPHRCWTGTAIAHYDRAPCPTLRAALAPTAAEQTQEPPC